MYSSVLWTNQLLFADILVALPFILLLEEDLLIASANCWHGVRIVFSVTHLGMVWFRDFVNIFKIYFIFICVAYFDVYGLVMVPSLVLTFNRPSSGTNMTFFVLFVIFGRNLLYLTIWPFIC
jgi:hypothetical protein